MHIPHLAILDEKGESNLIKVAFDEIAITMKENKLKV